jgi:hypothetical protein
MDVLSVEEQEDGSAIVTLNMTQKENDILVEHAVIDILKKQIERMDNEHRTDRNNGGVQSDETLEFENL